MTTTTEHPTLFDTDELDHASTEWQLVPDWDRCGLCGIKCSWNQGGTSTAGAVCDECANIDRCQDVDGRHVTHWGHSHTPDDHQALLNAQTRRRTRYLTMTALAGVSRG